MTSNSPFGTATGVVFRAKRDGDHADMTLDVLLSLNEGITSCAMRLAADSPGISIQKNGFGILKYTTNDIGGGVQSVEATIAYCHDADSDNLDLVPLLHFNPHGSVTLKDVTLALSEPRGRTATCRLPLDVKEETFSRNRRGRAAEWKPGDPINKGIDTERLYGGRLDALAEGRGGGKKRRDRDNRDDRDDDDDKKVRVELLQTMSVRYAMQRQDNGVNVSVPQLGMENGNKECAEANTNHGNHDTTGNMTNGSSASVKLPRLEDVRSFAAHRRRAEEAEARLSVQLKKEWDVDLKSMLRGMFRDRKRVVQLLRMWHSSSPPVPTIDTPNSAVLYSKFISALMTCPRELIVTSDHVAVFRHPSLTIPVEQLTAAERAFFDRLTVNRHRLFGSVNELDVVPREYYLDKFRLNDTVASVVCPRFIVQQLVIDCIDCGIRTSCADLIVTVCSAVAKCWARNKRDPFLSHLLGAVENASNVLEEVAILGTFVSIAGSKPTYELFSTSEEARILSQQPRKANLTMRTPTPYRLIV